MLDPGEIYPPGGSVDGLGLFDPDTGYCGRSLLEGLIRDPQVQNLSFQAWKHLFMNNFICPKSFIEINFLNDVATYIK